MTRADGRFGVVVGFAVALACAAAGCGPSVDSVYVGSVTQPPAQVHITSASIQIPVGITVAVKPTPMRNGEVVKATMNMRSDNADILGCDAATTTGEFVLFGAREGNTTIEILADGDVVTKVTATVGSPVAAPATSSSASH